MISPRAVFRFIYGSSYFILCVLTAALLLITPGDAIFRAYQNKQQYNIWILVAALGFTVVIISFIYTLRLYNNKTILASIPKPWVPIEKGDLPKKVYDMITSGLDRSAAITFEARPRVVQCAPETRQLEVGITHSTKNRTTPSASTHGLQEKRRERTGEKEQGREEDGAVDNDYQLLKLRDRKSVEMQLGGPLPPRPPVWGQIEHGGWASPESPDLPNLQYIPVVFELPHLLEAKALTHAPPDPTAAGAPSLDPDAVALLQRPPNRGLREYLTRLSDLGVLPMDSTTTEFLSLYEHARFSTRALSGAQFRDLMHLFSEVLRNMGPLDPTVFEPVYDADDVVYTDSEPDPAADGGDTPTESSTGNDDDTTPPFEAGPAASAQSTPSRAVTRGSRGLRRQTSFPPNAARSSAGGDAISRTSTATGSIKRTRRQPTWPLQRQQQQQQQQKQPYHASSQASLRTAASSSGASATSVIRLAGPMDATDLPYVLTLTDSR
ncbi:hypothetical protein SODALDRAFT_327796 [Sodiomyces alkalinus F11]|uniref:Defect at low temperature protein 1 n=1 Tax=Sodiomyces alkalinus (strain CBS 110278 / VKM F-3762 / F11) TaxID=1314773 RepID=A0A3N2QA14_SODAK|nr:hypothetical protein SODALDRAFT_327796 [Sodiomyces alkalinus F11]ROT43591.1 hypothetical protein SODALDRAFT_327796 [Sodiomyces alkalinus F11]